MSIKFKIIPNSERTPSEGKSIAYLWTDNWNDWFKYCTLYVLTLFDAEGRKHEIGGVKIGEFGMTKEQSRPNLSNEFPRLTKSFFSLGQDVSYYIAISQLPEDERSDLLKRLRDVVADPHLFRKAAHEDVMGESLLRSVSVRSIEGQFKRVLDGGAILTDYSFRFEGPKPKSDKIERLSLEFSVTPDSRPPTNIHVLIGRNGVGKTFILNCMTRTLVSSSADDDEDGIFTADDDFKGEVHESPFANIVSVTFSAFDDFSLLPERKNALKGVRYSNIGLRKRVKNKNDEWVTITRDPTELADEFSKSARSCLIGEKANRYHRALSTLEADPIFAEAEVSALAKFDEQVYPGQASQLFRNLSSGHKIVLLTITKLVEKVEEQTLVLMDEPEAHLHPPLLSAFIRALSDLLINRNGVAIIATHSPVVLQEAPKSCVSKIVRHGVAAKAYRPDIETFAENVGVLTREVFGLEVVSSGFHKMLGDAIGDSQTIAEVAAKFDNEIGSEGRALLSSLLATRKTGGDN